MRCVVQIITNGIFMGVKGYKFWPSHANAKEKIFMMMNVRIRHLPFVTFTSMSVIASVHIFCLENGLHLLVDSANAIGRCDYNILHDPIVHHGVFFNFLEVIN